MTNKSDRNPFLDGMIIGIIPWLLWGIISIVNDIHKLAIHFCSY